MDTQKLDGSVRFSCGSCTSCCDQPWHTMIEAAKAKALDRHDFSAYPQLERKVFYHKSKNRRHAGYFRLAKGEGTRCIFLDTDGLCIIHKELGPEAKPQMCRQFPYLSARVGDRVSVNYGCPAVQSRTGSPLVEQSSEVEALVARPRRLHDPQSPVPLDATCKLSAEDGDALFDRAVALFEGHDITNVWRRFATLLSLLAEVRERKNSSASMKECGRNVVDLLRSGSDLAKTLEVPEIHAYGKPTQSPMQTRLLFAATLYPDTIPSDAVAEMGLLRRLTLIPKLMALGTLTGVYPSRMLGRNISIQEVMEHEVEEELDAEAVQLLLRYFRSRLWQRYLVGTGLSIVACVHQHIHDFNAIIFLARGEALASGSVRLTAPMIRKSLTAVEFHLANQVRLHDHTLRGWFLGQLDNPQIALASLRLMALRRAPQHDESTAGTSSTAAHQD